MDFANDIGTEISEKTGFPNPATDSNITSLNLNKLLIKHPSSTFFMEIDGNSWEHTGVYNGDIALIDRALEPKDTSLVVWWDESGFVLSRCRDMPVDREAWGTVSAIVHRYET